jgi:hydrogenase maturation factor HypF (carbamoyltransferase family)
VKTRGHSLAKELEKELSKKKDPPPLRLFMVPCSCGTTFAVPEKYDQQGTAWTRYLICPGCKKRHDPKNRLLRVGYQDRGFWQVDGC